MRASFHQALERYEQTGRSVGFHEITEQPIFQYEVGEAVYFWQSVGVIRGRIISRHHLFVFNGLVAKYIISVNECCEGTPSVIVSEHNIEGLV